eukprot:TRINITY_DN56_c0_g1_i2.p1 TRINITY_DN56_c0_g1~~TRINITY_DN56_c0_g1_i2.p1  ORF type:complete len:432 (+),score=90.81 TRINITY_DN56_c0_g1_i2:164-1459(+)
MCIRDRVSTQSTGEKRTTMRTSGRVFRARHCGTRGYGTSQRHTPAAVTVLAAELTVKSGKGSWIQAWDSKREQQRRLLDMSCGIGATSTGHCHPNVAQAVRKQAGTIVHAQQNIFGGHDTGNLLIEQLLTIVPDGLGSFFFANSGSEAIDNAIKIARVHTARPNIISFTGGFHGRTIGAMSLTSSKTSYKQGFQPLMPGCFFAPWPSCLTCEVRYAQDRPYHLAPDILGSNNMNRTCCDAPITALKNLLQQQTDPSETAAILVEPIQGEGGILTPPPEFLAQLRTLCSEHGILLIFDEVQSGAGRTGKWWAHQHWDVKPDMMVFAKGIASGYQLAGVAARPEIMASPGANTLGGTYGFNAIASAAAVATIQTIQQEGLLENTSKRGEQLCKGLMELAHKHPQIVDVRGRGLMIGVLLDLSLIHISEPTRPY